ncbi:MAG: ComEC family competence protein [Candidatus Omnitrophica bacterium]|nr:ComEC family competence protein [Candidatus Omnitrophota bacterium]
MKRPLCFICISVIAGILSADLFLVSFRALIPALAVLIAGLWFYLRNSRLFFVFLFFASFTVGMCLVVNSRTLAPDHIAKFTPAKGKEVTLKGRVVSEPEQRKNRDIFLLEAETVEMNSKVSKTQGKVLVVLFKEVKGIDYGKELILRGKLYRPYAFRISRRLNYRDYLMRRGIYSMLSVSKAAGEVIFTREDIANPLLQAAFVLRKKITAINRAYLSANAAGVISAMVVGLRHEVPSFFNNLLQHTGTIHILAVSGLHVGIMVFLVIMALRLFAMPYRLQYSLAILMLVFFCLLSGARTSVVRATVMAGIFLVAFLVNRDYDPLSALSLAALVILSGYPLQIFDAGFQLSFSSVLSIFLFHEKISACFPKKLLNHKSCAYLLKMFAVSLAAWLGTLGITAYHFSIITPVAVIANMAVIPLLFVVVVSAVLFLAGTMISPLLAAALALNCEFFVNLVYKINAVFFRLPGAYYYVPGFKFAYAAAYYCAVIIVIAGGNFLVRYRRNLGRHV